MTEQLKCPDCGWPIQYGDSYCVQCWVKKLRESTLVWPMWQVLFGCGMVLFLLGIAVGRCAP